MDLMTWLLRAARWARRPPSAQMVKLVLGVIAAGLLLAGYEYLFGWPVALTIERVRPPR